MKHADLTELRLRIVDLARDSLVGERVENVAVEVDEDGDGRDFLRVILQLKGVDALQVGDVEPLVIQIEELVAQMDERFPSVRFAEAA